MMVMDNAIHVQICDKFSFIFSACIHLTSPPCFLLAFPHIHLRNIAPNKKIILKKYHAICNMHGYQNRKLTCKIIRVYEFRQQNRVDSLTDLFLSKLV